MDSEARAHVVDGQKRHSVSFLGRGLNVCSHRRKKREHGLQKQSSFLLLGDIERVLSARYAEHLASLRLATNTFNCK